jgi:hypothetical protein
MFGGPGEKPSYLLGKMVRPGGFELPTFWFVAARSTLPNLARGVANRANSASWNKSPQTIFSFICRCLLHICRYFVQFALHFRDRRHYHLRAPPRTTHLYFHQSDQTENGIRVRRCCQIFQTRRFQPVSNLSQCLLFTFRKQQPTLDLTSDLKIRFSAPRYRSATGILD